LKALYVTLGVVLLDQITKLLVHGFSFLGLTVKGMEYGSSIDILGSFLRLTYVENPGIAFGIDIGVANKLLLTVFTFVLIVVLLFYFFKNLDKSTGYKIAIAFIIGGAIGNFIDRMFYGVLFDYAPLFYGKVVDFINFEFFDFTLFGKSFSRFPIFNVADSAVTIGVILLIFFSPKTSDVEESEKKPDVDEPIAASLPNDISEDNHEISSSNN
jgi:signal peptidase II